MNPSPKLSASVSMTQGKSHALLITAFICLTLIAISGITAFTFGHWIPGILGCLIPAIGFHKIFQLWRQSAQNIDMDGAKQTTFEANADGIKIAIDPRAIMSPDGMKLMAQALAHLAHRTPLPEPDGLVQNGVVIPNSKHLAIKTVSDINAQLQNDANALMNSGILTSNEKLKSIGQNES